MRTIKFRAWNKKTSKIVDLYKITPLATAPEFEMDGLFIPFDEEYVLMQHTGLKDKNGKEIYEGDILYRKRPGMFKGDPDREEKSVVTWNEDECGFCSDKSGTSIYYSTKGNPIPYYVIGNIYENPELLNI